MSAALKPFRTQKQNVRTTRCCRLITAYLVYQVVASETYDLLRKRTAKRTTWWVVVLMKFRSCCFETLFFLVFFTLFFCHIFRVG